MEEGRLSCSRDNGFSLSGRKSCEVDAARIGEKLILPVRLGKFKNMNERNSGEGKDMNGNSNQNGVIKREEGESSSSNLDARRCYSMGSYQYVVGDANLKVSLCTESKRFADAGTRGGPRFRGINANSVINEDMDGKRISASSKGESFSVSKIWQWPNNKGKMPVISTEISSMDSSSLASTRRSLGDT
ncbi:RING-H2 finger protein ATL5I [Carex littledalei]|uniref:RING-H2 finger protein ATL5I n=1 Tax=Carex littledalei TaxID=544730 RepID=A0A833VNQ2_9POAL|nr:RING-H2 finger protein ATL5I [Carex littledalei]